MSRPLLSARRWAEGSGTEVSTPSLASERARMRRPDRTAPLSLAPFDGYPMNTSLGGMHGDQNPVMGQQPGRVDPERAGRGRAPARGRRGGGNPSGRASWRSFRCCRWPNLWRASLSRICPTPTRMARHVLASSSDLAGYHRLGAGPGRCRLARVRPSGKAGAGGRPGRPSCFHLRDTTHRLAGRFAYQ
jgi:hypothetical protein